jgi:hypothetical protein
MMASPLDGDGEELMCLDCADGRACVVERCAGLGREESSVSPRVGTFGEVVFAGEKRDAIHRTPEELGLSATVPDVPELKAVTMTWGDEQARGSMSAARLKCDVRPTMRTIVAAPAAAVDEVKREESDKVKDGVKCAYEGCGEMAYSGRKYCTSRHGYKNRAAASKKPAESPRQMVDIDPARPGTASALMSALNRVDQGKTAAAPGVDPSEVRLKIEILLTQKEVDRVLDRLDAGQRLAFLNDGLRAALLA